MNGCEISLNRTGNGGHGGAGALGSGNGGNGGRGGGLYAFLGSAVVIDNCTISSNETGAGGLGASDGDGGDGGGIYGDTSLAIYNGTVANNSAAERGDGGGIWSRTAAFLVQDTIIADNEADTGSDCYGDLTSGGHNLIFDFNNCNLGGSQTSDITGVDPWLGPLQINAPGSTTTHAIPFASPAIDAGGCSRGLSTLDQRGVSRPQGEACDIGAYEFDPAAWRFRYFPLIPAASGSGR